MDSSKTSCVKYLKKIANEINDLASSYENFYDYFSDLLGYEFRISSEGEYYGVYIYLACDSLHHVWINTFGGTVETRHGSELFEEYLNDDILKMIDERYEEFYELLQF